MAFEDASDVELLQLATAGEEAAFGALFRRWQGNIYRFTLRISNSPTLAEDVSQEVFLALINGAFKYDPELGSFSSYLYGIARNHALRRLSRERVFISMVEDPADERRDSARDWGESPDPLGALTRQETIDTVSRAVASLPLRYREVVVLCEFQELSYAEAACVIGCPEGTIRSRLHRARILLLEKLRAEPKAGVRAPGIEPVRCLP